MEFAAVTTRLEHDRRLSALKIRRGLELAFRAVPLPSSLPPTRKLTPHLREQALRHRAETSSRVSGGDIL
jgi:hypothetical protein